MRVNEYNSLEEFTSQYIGEWAPSDGHWLGLEFRYKGEDYRLHTGAMFSNEPKYNPHGEEIVFRLYKVVSSSNGSTFVQLAAFSSMKELLKYSGIDSRPFSEIIMDDNTQMTGKD